MTLATNRYIRNEKLHCLQYQYHEYSGIAHSYVYVPVKIDLATNMYIRNLWSSNFQNRAVPVFCVEYCKVHCSALKYPNTLAGEVPWVQVYSVHQHHRKYSRVVPIVHMCIVGASWHKGYLSKGRSEIRWQLLFSNPWNRSRYSARIVTSTFHHSCRQYYEFAWYTRDTILWNSARSVKRQDQRSCKTWPKTHGTRLE